MSSGTFRRLAAAFVVLGSVGGIAAAPAYADSPSPSPSGSVRWSPISISAAGECGSPAVPIPGTPWALQRVLLDQLWKYGGTGQGATVAVIDTGVDNTNPQLAGKVEDGTNLLPQPQGNAQVDPVGHGTKVAGIIAARHSDQTGFVGLAPDARILSIRQNDNQGHGDVYSLIKAIDIAIRAKVKVINISQDVRANNDGKSQNASQQPGEFDGKDDLKKKLQEAEDAGIVVVASSGNDGHEGATFPAGFSTVLAVGASDRNNERASFSQYGDETEFPNLVAAPGVDMVSTVPVGGQCVDNGTSFSSPYVAGLAVLLKMEHGDWSPSQIRTQIEQTAQRTGHGRNSFIGWGVVDPVKAVQPVTTAPGAAPTQDPKVKLDTVPIVARPLGLAETQADRDRRSGTFVLGGGALLVAALGGGAVVVRDFNRRRRH